MTRKRCLVLAVLLTGALGLAVLWGTASMPRPAAAKAPGPNGRILFVVDTDVCDDCHLTSIDPDGSDPLEYPDLSIGRWSPDGARIAAIVVMADGRIGTVLADADGSAVTPVDITSPTLNVACFAWAPDGDALLCEGWDDVHPERLPGLFSVDVDTSHINRVTSNRLGGHDIPADYSPDGTQILFAREDAARKQRPMALFVADSDGADATRITPWSPDASGSWSPDGSRIVFARKGGLRTITPDGTRPSAIPVDFGGGDTFAYGPGWSPDGERIVFSLFLERTGQVDLFTVAADGTDLVQLTDSPEPDESADWGPAPPVTG
jgi:Tol biopolymer transport system component